MILILTGTLTVRSSVDHLGSMDEPLSRHRWHGQTGDDAGDQQLHHDELTNEGGEISVCENRDVGLEEENNGNVDRMRMENFCKRMCEKLDEVGRKRNQKWVAK